MVFAPGGQSVIFASQDGRVRSWHFDKKTEPITAARWTSEGSLGAGLHSRRRDAALGR